MYEETVKDKPTGNDLDFITYSKTIYFDGILLDNSGYLITQWKFFVKEQAVSYLKKWEEQKNPSRLGTLVLKKKY